MEDFTLRQASFPAGPSTGTTKGSALTHAEMDNNILNIIELANGPGQIDWDTQTQGKVLASPAAATGALSVRTLVAGDLPAATTSAKGAVELATDGEVAANVAVQGNDSRLSDSRTPTAHNHSTSDINAGTLGVARGGTGAGTLASHGVMVGNGTGAVAVTGTGTAGQVLTSNGASADPTFQNVPTGSVDMLDDFFSVDSSLMTEVMSVSVGVGNYEVHVLLQLTTGAAEGFQCELAGGTATIDYQALWADGWYIDTMEVYTEIPRTANNSAYITASGNESYWVQMHGFIHVSVAGTVLVTCAWAAAGSTPLNVQAGSAMSVR